MENASSVEIQENEIICNCFQIKESTIRSLISKNSVSAVEEVTSACEAGGNCGSCHILIQLFIDQNKHQKNLEQTSESEETKSKNEKMSFWKQLLRNS